MTIFSLFDRSMQIKIVVYLKIKRAIKRSNENGKCIQLLCGVLASIGWFLSFSFLCFALLWFDFLQFIFLVLLMLLLLIFMVILLIYWNHQKKKCLASTKQRENVMCSFIDCRPFYKCWSLLNFFFSSLFCIEFFEVMSIKTMKCHHWMSYEYYGSGLFVPYTNYWCARCVCAYKCFALMGLHFERIKTRKSERDRMHECKREIGAKIKAIILTIRSFVCCIVMDIHKQFKWNRKKILQFLIKLNDTNFFV